MELDPSEPDVVRHQGAACPHCRVVHNAAVITEGPAHKPVSGDFSLCISCGEPAVFVVDPPGARVALRACTPDEQAEVERAHADDLARVRAFVQWRRLPPQERGALP